MKSRVLQIKDYREVDITPLLKPFVPDSHCHANNQRLQLLMEHTAASYEPDFLLIESGTVRDQTQGIPHADGRDEPRGPRTQ